MSDAVSPVARAPVVGVYRFWRDIGYALGGLIAGVVADALGYGGAITIVAGVDRRLRAVGTPRHARRAHPSATRCPIPRPGHWSRQTLASQHDPAR